VDDLRQPLIEHVWRLTLRRAQEKKLVFKPIPYVSSFACTETFYRWWRDYYKRQSTRVDPDSLLPQLMLAFNVQRKLKKNKGTHIREIQAFQKFFQTAYNPLHLKRTINYAAQT